MFQGAKNIYFWNSFFLNLILSATTKVINFQIWLQKLSWRRGAHFLRAFRAAGQRVAQQKSLIFLVAKENGRRVSTGRIRISGKSCSSGGHPNEQNGSWIQNWKRILNSSVFLDSTEISSSVYLAAGCVAGLKRGQREIFSPEIENNWPNSGFLFKFLWVWASRE